MPHDTRSRTGRLVCVGSYTKEAGGHGIGITTFWQDPRDGTLEPAGSVAVPAPSYLVWHPALPVLYAANELTEGTVTALRAEPDGRLRPMGVLPSGGATPCHLALTPDRRYLLCANYGGGSLAVFELDDAGRLVERVDLVRHRGHGPHPERQEASHVHMAVPRRADDTVSAVDLGTDEVRAYRLSAAGRLEQVECLSLPPGFGPRQLIRHPSMPCAYVVGELASALITLSETANGPRVTGTVPATIAAADGDLPSHLGLSDDGRFLYLAVRGADRISVFATEPDGLRPVGEWPSGGAWPRQFTLAGRWLYVANQNSDLVTAFTVDPATGAPSLTAHYPVSTPTCVAVAPRKIAGR
ncbi:lactonase family protein [Actinoallomurus sp. NPDC052274]|uniref:lactonase family protein n=1 Tax=Actinoallomurus sp. NPDC052274 TaxID=3155420 RepID=UPI00341A8A98